MTGSIATAAGRFTAEMAGPAAGPLVILLHGFPQTRHSWRQQVPALGAAGYRAIAPDQRVSSPGVRPDPAVDLSAYGVDRLVADENIPGVGHFVTDEAPDVVTAHVLAHIAAHP